MDGRSAFSFLLSAIRGRAADGSFAALGIVALLACILVPLPTPLLDILLVLNMVLALVVLLRGLSVTDPVRLYSFPAILLCATLFRLALNVSSTRLILTQGTQGLQAAGEVIRSFGGFVVRGDFFVGVILFAVIAVVNFVVIAKGSARVAEVAARFVLDSLPGKQLAIDADLRAGSITREEAEARRAHLAQESQFFGAMDGAMKFVQGDAVAGMLIVAINAVGGIALGKSRGMEFSDAVNTFGVLTIGEGLVNILPSLLMSLSAGIIVTHVSGPRPTGTGSAVVSQLLADTRILVLSAFALLFFGVLPGFPLAPFAVVALGLLVVARLSRSGGADGRWTTLEAEELPAGSPSQAAALPGRQTVLLPWTGSTRGGPDADSESDADELPALLLEVDTRVIGPYLERRERSGTDAGFSTLFGRRAELLCRERGMPHPALRVRIREQFGRGEYRVSVFGQVARQGILDDSALMLGGPSSIVSLFGGTPVGMTRHPLDGRGATWFRVEGNRESNITLAALQRLGAEVLSPADVLVCEVLGALLQSADQLIGVEETKGAVLKLRERSTFLVEELFDRNILTYSELAEILRRLVRERISVRDLKRILELVAEFAALESDTEDRLAWVTGAQSFVRTALVRGVLRSAGTLSGRLRVFLLADDVEEEFRSAQSEWEQRRSRVPIPPQLESALRENAKRMFQPVLDRGNVPIYLLCAGDVRPAVDEFFQRVFGNSDSLRTLAYHEVDRFAPESVGILGA